MVLGAARGAARLSLVRGDFEAAIDVPGATSTKPYGISNSGSIVGLYIDVTGANRGFLYAGGSFTTVDFPGADLTSPQGVNSSGSIVGYYEGATGGWHGFVATSNSTLSVLKLGTGSGTVTSSPAGIDCGSDCSESFNCGTVVTLTATPTGGSVFTGWSGACSGAGTCTITMDANKTVAATFAQYTLTILKSGAGTGTVTSKPPGINCGNVCSETFSEIKKVTMTAKAAANSTFTGWSGACLGTGSCRVTVNGPTTVTASFALKIPHISVAQTSLYFGSVKVGKKATKTLRITNNGSGDLVIRLSGLEETDFSIQGSSNVTMKAKRSYLLRVLFTPESAGSMTATLGITSNDPDTPTLDITLNGTGQLKN